MRDCIFLKIQNQLDKIVADLVERMSLTSDR